MEALHEKKCSVCGEVKVLSEFYKHKTSKDGFTGICKQCTRDRSNGWREANIERARASDRLRRSKAESTEEEWKIRLARGHKENQSEAQWNKKLENARKENIEESLWETRRKAIQDRTLKENCSEEDWEAKIKYDKEYRDCHRDNIRESCRKWRNKSIKKTTAHRLVWAAIKKGHIEQGTCEVCGSGTVHGHHADYDKPLEVMWLCPEHHWMWHAEYGEGLNGV